MEPVEGYYAGQVRARLAARCRVRYMEKMARTAADSTVGGVYRGAKGPGRGGAVAPEFPYVRVENCRVHGFDQMYTGQCSKIDGCK